MTEVDVVTMTVGADSGPTAAPPSPPAAPTSVAAQSYGPAPAPPSSSAAPPPPAQSSTAPSSGGSSSSAGLGITYAAKRADASCKNQDEINKDFDALKDYSIVRIYDTGCPVGLVLQAVKSHGKKLFAGVPDIGQVSSEVQTLIDACKNDWGLIDTVAVGNELMTPNPPLASADQVVAAVNGARTQLRNAGYQGPVVTVDTSGAHLQYPQLCEHSDYCAVNAHAFFNAQNDASVAGKFVLGQAEMVSSAHGGKNTVVTESGWPSQGQPNGKAVPSPSNQETAISALKSSFSGNLILFSAFNEPYKQNNGGTFGAEQFWGILGNA